ncbi:MAG: homocysteine biosynthesis protein, partial [Cyanobacteria bacterium P01_H01_bin.153]
MPTLRTLATINNKIRRQTAVVETAEAFKARAAADGIAQAFAAVDVVTTGTFEPMESSGAILNIGHADPPINIRDCRLDGVPAYAGFGAVDLYLGASQPAAAVSPGEMMPQRERGGGHVIADLVAGKSVQLQATGQITDCYPRGSLN